jgi:hypothetical protein
MNTNRMIDESAQRLFGWLELRAADGVILASLATFSLLAVIGRKAVEGWPLLVARNLAIFAAVLISAAVTPRVRRPILALFFRTATVLLSYAWLFGVQPTVWLERFITPALTE